MATQEVMDAVMIVIDIGIPLAILHIELVESVIGNIAVNDHLDIHTGVIMGVIGLHNTRLIDANFSKRHWLDVY